MFFFVLFFPASHLQPTPCLMWRRVTFLFHFCPSHACQRLQLREKAFVALLDFTPPWHALSFPFCSSLPVRLQNSALFIYFPSHLVSPADSHPAFFFLISSLSFRISWHKQLDFSVLRCIFSSSRSSSSDTIQNIISSHSHYLLRNNWILDATKHK